MMDLSSSHLLARLPGRASSHDFANGPERSSQQARWLDAYGPLTTDARPMAWFLWPFFQWALSILKWDHKITPLTSFMVNLVGYHEIRHL
jgi:hypothetical protein